LLRAYPDYKWEFNTKPESILGKKSMYKLKVALKTIFKGKGTLVFGGKILIVKKCWKSTNIQTWELHLIIFSQK
jgi:hypothetical protein